jgi:hypothetical protein
MAKGRIPVGAEVQKVKSHESDTHAVGTKGRVTRFVGTVPHPSKKGELIHGYTILWAGEKVETMIFDDGRLAVLRSVN